MRILIPLTLLVVAANADDKQFVPVGGFSLEAVYGPIAGVDATVPWYQRTRRTLPDNYFDVRTHDNCVFPLEIYIIQDETESFADNYKQMKDEELKDMFLTMTSNHPNSTFGVGTHRDIPIWSLGAKTDYCWKFQLPLQSDWKPLYDTYDKLVSTGGGDAPEHQFGSIIAACQSDTSGWSNPLATRLVVVSTDAQPHFEGDGFDRLEYNLGRYSGRFEEDNAKEQCETQYYPKPELVKKALEKREAYAAFLVFDGEYGSNPVQWPINAWKWFNGYIGQHDRFVANVTKGAENWWECLSDVIKELSDLECIHKTTEKPKPHTTEKHHTTEGHHPTEPPTTHHPTEPRTTTTTTQPPTTTTTQPPTTTTTQPPTTTTTQPPTTTTTQPPTTTTTQPPTTTTTQPPTTTTTRAPTSRTTTRHGQGGDGQGGDNNNQQRAVPAN